MRQAVKCFTWGKRQGSHWKKTPFPCLISLRFRTKIRKACLTKTFVLFTYSPYIWHQLDPIYTFLLTRIKVMLYWGKISELIYKIDLCLIKLPNRYLRRKASQNYFKVYLNRVTEQKHTINIAKFNMICTWAVRS